MNAIIPLRIGELVRAYLLGRRHGIAVSITLFTAILERVFDVVAIVIIGLLVSTMLDLPPLLRAGLRTFAFLGVAGCRFSTDCRSGGSQPNDWLGLMPMQAVCGG